MKTLNVNDVAFSSTFDYSPDGIISIPFADCVKGTFERIPADSPAFLIYKPDFVKGEIKCEMLKSGLSGHNSSNFELTYKGLYYTALLADCNDSLKALAGLDVSNMNVATRKLYDCLVNRFQTVRNACADVELIDKKDERFDSFAWYVFCADSKQKFGVFSEKFQNSVKSVMNKLADVQDSNPDTDAENILKADLSELKGACTEFGKLVCGDSFRVNYTFVRGIYKAYSKGVKRNKRGEFDETHMSKANIAVQLINRCYQYLCDK